MSGVAAGVTAVFGTPLGGVLFSIEVTANYYAVSNLWQSVICSSICVLTFELIRVFNEDTLFENTTLEGFEIRGELFAFLVLGALCGVSSLSYVGYVPADTRSIVNVGRLRERSCAFANPENPNPHTVWASIPPRPHCRVIVKSFGYTLHKFHTER